MNEARFNAYLTDKLGGHHQRIESTIGSGIPDINICKNGQEIWIESKIVTPQGLVLLRPYQFSWGMRRAHHGGRVFVIALDVEKDIIIMHHFPFGVQQYGKYVKIVSKPRYIISKSDITFSLLIN